jgi:2-phospho-L-lactate guanylyltransferase
MATLAILPMKPFEEAKQRLDLGLAPMTRRALAEAMFSDVLVALRRAAAVDDILVVTRDKGAQQIAGGNGAQVLDDAGSGHNAAAALGIQHALELGYERALLVPGDCPTLDPGEVDVLLARDGEGERSAVIVPDRHGTGTNALVLTPPDSLVPAFGPGSRARHETNARAEHSVPAVVEVPTLALDVDTPEDLAALRAALSARRGGAAHTRGMLAQLHRSRN